MQRKKKEEERNGFSLYRRFRSLRKLKNHNFPSVSDSANMLFLISATSSGREFSLRQTSGGRCSTHNMRFMIYVCRDTNGKSNFYVMSLPFSTQGRPLFRLVPRPIRAIRMSGGGLKPASVMWLAWWRHTHPSLLRTNSNVVDLNHHLVSRTLDVELTPSSWCLSQDVVQFMVTLSLLMIFLIFFYIFFYRFKVH